MRELLMPAIVIEDDPDPADIAAWSPIRASESPHHLKHKNMVADYLGKSQTVLWLLRSFF